MQLLYMQARYYDPMIGRFYSNDPLDTLGHFGNNNIVSGFNRYTYANNNPYKYIDPTGLMGECASGQCGANDEYPISREFDAIIESELTDTQIEAFNQIQAQVLKNKFIGQTAEEVAAEHIQAENPDSQVGIGGVTLKVDGSIRFPDITVAHPNGDIEFVEVKANNGIPTKGQITKDRLIQSGGANVVTSRHSFLPTGFIGPTNVKLVNVKVN